MKKLKITHLFEILDRGHCIAIGECRFIGSYFRAIRKSFTTNHEYVGPWVNYTNHSNLTYVFTPLPVSERFTFVEDEDALYVHSNDGLQN